MLKQSHTQIAVALYLASASVAWAQQDLNEITITAESPQRIYGFDGVPQRALPFSINTISHDTLQDIGAQRVSEALRLDASVSDSYNLPAYWDKLSVRGFTLDNRFNYRREGLPISAETIIAMDNKERIELLKGSSGIEAGTSAPGGLVNYVVKRAPTNTQQAIRNLTLSYGHGDNRLAAADLGGRFGDAAEFGYRFNVAHEDLNPYIRDTKGYRDLVALAMDWRINANSRLEWEIEQSHHEQIGVNFYSLLASAGPQDRNRLLVLPDPVDGTRNISRQPNSLPGVFDGLTGSVRLKHQLDSGWIWTTQYGSQRLHADDRLTYVSGCSSIQYDSFCLSPKGNFQVNDYRSENEHRKNEAIQTELSGQTQLGGLEHNIKLSLMRQRQLNQMPMSAVVTPLGTTNSSNGGLLPSSDPTIYFPNTNASNYTTEVALHDRVRITPSNTVWLGLRHTELSRQSIQTDGTSPVSDRRGMTTPWLALSHALNASDFVYASYGENLETESAPNSNRFTNAGQPLPVLRSTQREIGIKRQTQSTSWQATWFDITRPISGDAGVCDASAGSCTREIDGEAHHQGLELSATHTLAQWTLGGSGMWLNAKRENSTTDPSLNGQRPINVPNYILRGMAEYRFASLVGLRSGLRVSREGERNVTETGDIKLPAWTTLDASAHYDTKIGQTRSTLTLAVNNVADKRYWRESPKSYGQYFLYPGAPRTVRATLQFQL